ncbi:MAG TPA: hypothetical protein DCR93_33420 [Cytophagales bacterium]|nr:hypothetical protein [Cytophagales bacterium]HAP64179.1 hypothetical protein [Cytophagales bacterium]
MQDSFNHLRFALYARKSSESRDRQVLSIDSQKQELRLLAKRKGFKILAEFTDQASAHKVNNRPGFTALLEAIQKGEIDGILTWKCDRLARNMVEGGNLVYCLQNGVIQAIFTPDRTFLPGDNMIPLTLELGIANQFSLDLSKNVKRGIRAKIQQGGCCHKAPLGYKNDRLEKVVVRDEDRFEKVRRLFELYSSGTYSLRQLCGYAETNLKLRTQKGRPLLIQTLQKILTHPFYYGLVRFGVHEAIGAHEPMVSFTLWKQVQAILKSQGRKGITLETEGFNGLFRCGECGYGITRETKFKYKCPSCGKKCTAKHPFRCSCGADVIPQAIQKKKEYTYYHCHKGKPNPCGCTQTGVRSEAVESGVREIIRGLTIMPEMKDYIVTTMERLEANSATAKNGEHYQEERKKLESKLENLTERFAEQSIPEETYKTLSQRWNQEIRHLRGKEIENQTKNKDAEKTLTFAVNLESTFYTSDPKTKKQILRTLSEENTILDKEVKIELRPYFRTLLNLRAYYHKMAHFEPPQNHSGRGFAGALSYNESTWQALVEEFRNQFI